MNSHLPMLLFVLFGTTPKIQKLLTKSEENKVKLIFEVGKEL
jgi:hypothetical protein